jgi:hypothetical protein
MPWKMRIRVSIDHHVDASDIDAEGMHDWHYEYDVYRFSRGWRSFVARGYMDEPGKIAFLSCEVEVFGFYRHRLLSSADLKSSLFGAAVAHLQGLGMTSFDRLTKAGYVSIEDPDLAGATEQLRVPRRSKL